jgi:hypothetical protein
MRASDAASCHRLAVAPTIDVLIAGTQKGGTTSLTRYLDLHPGVVAHESLEFPYFTDPDRYRGYDAAYARHFRARTPAPGQLVLAKSVGVMFLDDAADRLARHNPRGRVIVVLRDPVERAWSAYRFLKAMGVEDASSFEEALALEDERLATDFAAYHHRAYRRRGDYLPQIAMLRARFGREAVRVCLLDDLERDPLGEVAATCEWLGLDPSEVPAEGLDQRFNETATARRGLGGGASSRTGRAIQRVSHRVPPAWRSRLRQALGSTSGGNRTPAPAETLDPATRHHLATAMRPQVEQLAAYLDRDLSAWSDVAPDRPLPAGSDSADETLRSLVRRPMGAR